MQTVVEFKNSLKAIQPDVNLSVQLKALWYDAKGDWHLAHKQVDQTGDGESAWVHAYLHRKEGDNGNADYWYRRAGKVRPDIDLAAEWQTLLVYFLK